MGTAELTYNFDVVVIGAGPAGCAAATLLAENGHRVAILEKQAMPRYRVGESLIPWCWFPLNRLGLIEQLDQAPFVIQKHSVQFVNTDGTGTTPFYFFKHTDHDCARTWQVRRSDFDQFLLDNAAAKGAQFFPETAAKEIVRESGKVIGVQAKSASKDDLQFRARLTIDATGRDMFAVSRNGWKVPDEKLRKIAIWTYFTGAKRDRGVDEGATTVAYLPDKGWFWYIPLPEDTVSVGVVAERDYLYRGARDPDVIFAREVEEQAWIQEHLAGATKVMDCRVTGDYSFRSRFCAEDGLVLAGDAFAFLDPVFSSGVFLALQSGVDLADAAHQALEEDDVSASRFADYGARFCHGIESMRRLVHAFYDSAFSFGSFMKSHPDLRGDLTDCLIGNLESDLEPLFKAVGEYVSLPPPLTHGKPLGV